MRLPTGGGALQFYGFGERDRFGAGIEYLHRFGERWAGYAAGLGWVDRVGGDRWDHGFRAEVGVRGTW